MGCRNLGHGHGLSEQPSLSARRQSDRAPVSMPLFCRFGGGSKLLTPKKHGGCWPEMIFEVHFVGFYDLRN